MATHPAWDTVRFFPDWAACPPERRTNQGRWERHRHSSCSHPENLADGRSRAHHRMEALSQEPVFL